MSSFHFDRTKYTSNRCKTELFRSKKEAYRVHDELPEELFKEIR